MVSPAVKPRPKARPSLATPHPVWGSPLDPCGPVAEGLPGRWWAFRVAPQAEFVVAHLMRARGVAGAWAPYETKWIRANRYVRGAKREVRRPACPGYVLARMAAPAEDGRAWLVALGVAGVLGVVGVAGRPLALPDGAVAELVETCRRRRARAHQRAMPTNRVFEVGAEVEGLSALLEGRRFRVVEIDGAFAEIVGLSESAAVRLKAALADLGAVA